MKSGCPLVRALGAMVFLSAAPDLRAISPDNPPAADNSVAAELAAFQVHEDFTISLFADESLGIAKPVAMQWDERGRLWVLCTQVYAQLKPGATPDDKLFILEDADGDGRADRSTVFARGLNMPSGFALGHGGVWLAEGADLLHLRDTDGDGRADERRVVLSGFGTGDTHQNISSLVFDSGGFLYFAQGLHIFSQVETVWGVVRGDTAGFWHFDPRIERLAPYGFPSMVSQNPRGITFDRWGALFLKSNGPHLCFATPGLIPTTHPRELMVSGRVGETPGKSMGAAIVESAHLPAWIQNHAVIAGYFAREVSAIPLVEEGSGFAVSAPVRLLYGGHESFRPVDILQGPDGAIYVDDWFNPIINHYQVSLRHPDRDYTHGRIWRLAAKGRAPVARTDLTKLATAELFEQLRSPERWTREQARRRLSAHPDPADLTAKLSRWIASLDPASSLDALALVEAAGVLESFGVFPPEVLDRLQGCPDPRARAVAARIIGRAPQPLPDAARRLAALLVDPHPRPRLEAVVACASQPGAASLKLALTALDRKTDRFIDYALRQSVFALEHEWREALAADIHFFGDPARLAFVLETCGGEPAAKFARDALGAEAADDARERLLNVMARVGNAADLNAVLDVAAARGRLPLLDALIAGWEQRPLKPAASPEVALRSLLAAQAPGLRIAALRLAGFWKTAGLADAAEQLAFGSGEPEVVRCAALRSLGALRGPRAAPALRRLIEEGDGRQVAIRRAAMEALVHADLPAAAQTAVGLVSRSREGDGTVALIAPLLGRADGPGALAAAFEKSGAAPDARAAQEMLTALNQAGRSDPALTPMLNRALGIQGGAPTYDPGRIRALAAAVREGKGNPTRGRDVFQLPQLTCVACHRVGDAGGVIGPPLTTVGAGMPLDQIVESVLWPERQIKEGYQPVSLTTKDGRVITGYLERETEDLIWYRNTTTPWILPLSRSDIAIRQSVPTLMPAGLTRSLTEGQLLDLIAYLASLKG